MYIHRYKIDNVLDVYRRQLSRRAVSKKDSVNTRTKLPQESVVISAEGKRQSIINRVSDKIFRKIVDFNKLGQVNPEKEPGGVS